MSRQGVENLKLRAMEENPFTLPEGRQSLAAEVLLQNHREALTGKRTQDDIRVKSVPAEDVVAPQRGIRDTLSEISTVYEERSAMIQEEKKKESY